MNRATAVLAALALAGCANVPAASVAASASGAVTVTVSYSGNLFDRTPKRSSIDAAAQAEADRVCGTLRWRADQQWRADQPASLTRTP